LASGDSSFKDACKWRKIGEAIRAKKARSKRSRAKGKKAKGKSKKPGLMAMSCAVAYSAPLDEPFVLSDGNDGFDLRRIATFLGNGETTTAASKRFRLSQGRISQIRRELFLAWQRFQGDEGVLVVA
jgi:hypothetical protein